MTVADWTDVESRVGRPLLPHERKRVEAFLEDAEAEIQRLGPHCLTDPLYHKNVVSVECSSVIRAARLPDSLESVVPQVEGVDYGSVPLTQGAVYLRRDERRKLGLPLSGSVQLYPTPDSIRSTTRFPDDITEVDW